MAGCRCRGPPSELCQRRRTSHPCRPSLRSSVAHQATFPSKPLRLAPNTLPFLPPCLCELSPSPRIPSCPPLQARRLHGALPDQSVQMCSLSEPRGSGGLIRLDCGHLRVCPVAAPWSSARLDAPIRYKFTVPHAPPLPIPAQNSAPGETSEMSRDSVRAARRPTPFLRSTVPAQASACSSEEQARLLFTGAGDSDKATDQGTSAWKWRPGLAGQ